MKNVIFNISGSFVPVHTKHRVSLVHFPVNRRLSRGESKGLRDFGRITFILHSFDIYIFHGEHQFSFKRYNLEQFCPQCRCRQTLNAALNARIMSKQICLWHTTIIEYIFYYCKIFVTSNCWIEYISYFTLRINEPICQSTTTYSK